MTTLEGLERYHGHFLNWYDTATTAPLQPRYVSTVDSGNLAASLIALAQGLEQLATEPQGRTQRLDGLIDTANILALVSASSAAGDGQHREVMTQINKIARTILAECRRASDKIGPLGLDALADQLAEVADGLEVAVRRARRAVRSAVLVACDRRRRGGARCAGHRDE